MVRFIKPPFTRAWSETESAADAAGKKSGSGSWGVVLGVSGPGGLAAVEKSMWVEGHAADRESVAGGMRMGDQKMASE
jgi:hypothetical protein